MLVALATAFNVQALISKQWVLRPAPSSSFSVTPLFCPPLQARVGTIVYGARNTLLGADGSWIAMLPQEIADDGHPSSCHSCSTVSHPPAAGSAQAVVAARTAPAAAVPPAPGAPTRPHPFHPNLAVRRGVLAEECAALMKAFFARRRKEAAEARAAGSSDSDGGRC